MGSYAHCLVTAGPEVQTLKAQLREHLKDSGITNVLKAQMRVLLVERLQRSHGLQLGRRHGAADPLCSAADSLVAEYLRASGMPYSLAVFQPESGLAAPLSLTDAGVPAEARHASQGAPAGAWRIAARALRQSDPHFGSSPKALQRHVMAATSEARTARAREDAWHAAAEAADLSLDEALTAAEAALCAAEDARVVAAAFARDVADAAAAGVGQAQGGRPSGAGSAALAYESRLAVLKAGEARLSASLLAVRRRVAVQRAAAARHLGRLAAPKPGSAEDAASGEGGSSGGERPAPLLAKRARMGPDGSLLFPLSPRRSMELA
ncbi:hypothetical protein WJX81_005459 [Elliptochloris bilobata]|uniref:LisH domain-containing protein n=1 Tax=Elliptochloris bilobata TaxID=381761 RepID=A0AAW1SIK4_9CHLO